MLDHDLEGRIHSHLTFEMLGTDVCVKIRDLRDFLGGTVGVCVCVDNFGYKKQWYFMTMRIKHMIPVVLETLCGDSVVFRNLDLL